jgi:hypothetical protein
MWQHQYREDLTGSLTQGLVELAPLEVQRPSTNGVIS